MGAKKIISGRLIQYIKVKILEGKTPGEIARSLEAEEHIRITPPAISYWKRKLSPVKPSAAHLSIQVKNFLLDLLKVNGLPLEVVKKVVNLLQNFV